VAASAAGVPVVWGGTYGAVSGPRLETAAEIDRLERDGVDMVGMTGMPEAALARELGMQYAAIAVVSNHAAGRGDSAQRISHEQINAVLEPALLRVRTVIEGWVANDD
jgi:5'-methylthioadenosine phosphorylase